MGYDDRDYSRSSSGAGGAMGVLNWLMTGSVPLFRVFGISVRMHAAFLIMLALVLLFGFGPHTPFPVKLQIVAILWGIVLLHEFGHCFGARWTGGSAELITLNPLGGLAYAMAANNPWSQGVTVAAGPLVNVVICLVTGVSIYFMHGSVPLLPYVYEWGWIELTYAISLGLLYFNMLPIFPLDGGQFLQALLWKPLGQYRSMWITVHVGLVGAILLMTYAVFARAGFGGGLMLLIGINCLINCIQWRQMLSQTDPYAYEGYMAESGYDRAHAAQQRQREKESATRAKRRQREEQEERREQEEVDRILAKVADQGMNSLSAGEKRVLARATENQRKRDAEREKRRRSSMY